MLYDYFQAQQIEELMSELHNIKSKAEYSESEASNLAASKADLERLLGDMKEQLDTFRAKVFGMWRCCSGWAVSRKSSACAQVLAHESHRRKLHNTILEMKGNIRVFCRLRPSADNEAISLHPLLDEGLPSGSGVELVMPGSTEDSNGPTHMFTFDKVFGPKASQENVFSEIDLLVQSALDGQKVAQSLLNQKEGFFTCRILDSNLDDCVGIQVCIFAYGQTGSGKTYTMLGSPLDQGIIPRAMDQIYIRTKQLESEGWAISLRASMMEIYNEEYRDLLGKGLQPGKTHRVNSQLSHSLSECSH